MKKEIQKDSIYRIFDALNKIKDYPREMENVSILVEGLCAGIQMSRKAKNNEA